MNKLKSISFETPHVIRCSLIQYKNNTSNLINNNYHFFSIVLIANQKNEKNKQTKNEKITKTETHLLMHLCKQERKNEEKKKNCEIDQQQKQRRRSHSKSFVNCRTYLK